MFRAAAKWTIALTAAMVMNVAHPFAQSQAINGTIEGTITDHLAPCCRASASPSPISTPATAASW